MSNRGVKVDRERKETLLSRREWDNAQDIYEVEHALKLPDGRLAVLTPDAICRLLDDKGKELKSFPAGKQGDYNGPGQLEVLPDGGVLISMWNAGKVVKFDADGKGVWEAKVKTPSSVAGLPNGNALVASFKDRYVAELDRAGKEVWRFKAEGEVTLAWR